MFVKKVFIGFLYITLLPIVSISNSAFANMSATSESIVNGKIKLENACTKKGGKNLSPQINVVGIPEGTKSLSIIMDDPDAVPVGGIIFVHWNVFNIPVNGTTYSLDLGAKPKGTIGKGHRGKGYSGMCPPDKEHTYRIAIYAQKGNVKAKASGYNAVKYTLEKFEKNFSSSVIEKTVINGDFFK